MIAGNRGLPADFPPRELSRVPRARRPIPIGRGAEVALPPVWIGHVEEPAVRRRVPGDLEAGLLGDEDHITWLEVVAGATLVEGDATFEHVAHRAIVVVVELDRRRSPDLADAGRDRRALRLSDHVDEAELPLPDVERLRQDRLRLLEYHRHGILLRNADLESHPFGRKKARSRPTRRPSTTWHRG